MRVDAEGGVCMVASAFFEVNSSGRERCVCVDSDVLASAEITIRKRQPVYLTNDTKSSCIDR